MRVDLAVHIVAGGLALASGFAALAAAKGAGVHRRSGMLFVYAMLVMALVGAGIAAARNVAAAGNVPIGLLTSYLVVTGLTAVRPPGSDAGARRLDRALLLVALALGATLVAFGVVAAMGFRRVVAGFPAAPFFVFGAVALLAAAGDARMIRGGGTRALRGAPRLVRHLWRMSFALLIAAFSFFLGQAKVIPKPVRIIPLLMVPPLVVLATMLWWLWRVRFRRAFRGVVRVGAPEAA
jgi:hypothetical protein